MKMIYKRILPLLLSVVLMLCTLAGCGKREDSTKDSKNENTSALFPADGGDFFGSGDIDPENAEIILEDGAAVDSTGLHREDGRSNGIDVSKWQGKIDWRSVAASNIDFAFIRIGYRGENGAIYKDDNADYNIQSAVAAGIPVGIYFFSTATSIDEAREEAIWTVSQIEGYPISYPVVYDCEGFRQSTSRMYTVNAASRTANALAFLAEISAAGYEAMLYGSSSELGSEAYWNIAEIEAVCKIWVAQYPAVPYPETDKPAYGRSVDAWQYTNKGSVAGIAGDVDMVVCYFERDTAKPKNSAAEPKAAAAPLTDDEKQYTAADDTVTAKYLTNLRSAATTKSSIVAALNNGETVHRTGIGKNGWSRLEWGTQTVYAITSYLTADLTPSASGQDDTPTKDIVNGNTFTPRNDSVRAKNAVNLRSLPTTDSEVVGMLSSDSFLPRTAVSDKGWSRLTYNGQSVYAVTSYLTTDPVPANGETAPPSAPVTTGFADVDEQVTAKEETNLRTAPSTVSSEIVYTLKNGEFVHRTGIHTNGWSRLEWGGQTVYAVSSYLTTEADNREEAQQ